MASDGGEAKLEVLVIDSGAIIRGHGTSFHRRAERFVTVQEVLAEIRDSKSRDLLAALPFELEVRSPSDESMAAVAAFAKKSGDFAALSMTDLKLIALTYTVEKELTGGASIRTEPRRAAPSPSPRAASAKPPKAPRASKAIPEGEAVDSVIYSLDDACCCADGAAGSAHSHSQQEEGGGFEEGEKEVDGEEQEDEGDESGDDEGNEGGEGEGEGDEEEEEEEETEEEETEEEDQEEEAVAEVAAAVALTTEPEPAPLSEQDFPSMGGAAPAARAPAGPSSWASVAKSGDTAALNRRQPRKPQPYKSILPSAAAVATAAAMDEDEASASAFASAAASTSVQPPASAGSAPAAPSAMPSRILGGNANGHSAQASVRAALEDDGEGWINTSNFKTRSLEDSFRAGGRGGKAAAAAAAAEEAAAVVGCITTDFSMQNVLMQMGLQVVSVDGMVVRTVKQWVLRCMACYQVHYAMDRLFCEKCGANHLSRVSCSVDATTGQLRLHLKKGYTPSTRGKLYSLPKPGQQGRYEGELLLREDQLSTGIWKQKKMAVARAVKSAFGEDVTGDVGLSVNKMAKIRVGLGKQNPNAAKGRERRGKSKK